MLPGNDSGGRPFEVGRSQHLPDSPGVGSLTVVSCLVFTVCAERVTNMDELQVAKLYRLLVNVTEELTS